MGVPVEIVHKVVCTVILVQSQLSITAIICRNQKEQNCMDVSILTSNLWLLELFSHF